MKNKEEDFLQREMESKEERLPYFEGPDGKILATGDMFRGPYTGITSTIDLNNPGRKLSVQEEKFD